MQCNVGLRAFGPDPIDCRSIMSTALVSCMYLLLILISFSSCNYLVATVVDLLLHGIANFIRELHFISAHQSGL